MDIEDIFNMTVAEVRYLLNTDRVVLFQFDENWVGDHRQRVRSSQAFRPSSTR